MSQMVGEMHLLASGPASSVFSGKMRGLGRQERFLLGWTILAAVATTLVVLQEGYNGGATVLVQAAQEVSLVDESAMRRAAQTDKVSMEDITSSQEATQASAAVSGGASDPVPAGHEIKVDMPLKALKGLKVGSVVKGKIERPAGLSGGGRMGQPGAGKEDFDTLDFTGQVRSLDQITVRGKLQSDYLGGPDEGVVTLKILTDQFMAPGTSVTGMVAGKIFKGLVTKAPSLNERLEEAEKRMRELTPPFCDEMCRMKKDIAAVQQRIRDYKTGRAMRREAARLEKRLHALENPPGPPESVKIVGNWAGFRFDVPSGPDEYSPRIKQMEERLFRLQGGYADTMRPLYKRTRKLERKLDKMQGKKQIHERLLDLQQELQRVEDCMRYASNRKACVQSIVDTYNFHKAKAAQEEEDKAQFVQPNYADSFVPPTWDPPAKPYWNDPIGTKSRAITLRQAGAVTGRVDAGGHALHSSAAKQTIYSAQQVWEAAAAAAAAASQGQVLSSSSRREKAGTSAQDAAKPNPTSTWAPGQKQVWQEYLKKTNQMNHIADSSDNVIAQWFS